MVVNGSNPWTYGSQPQAINAVQPQPPVSNPQRRQQYIFVPPMMTSSQQSQAGNMQPGAPSQPMGPGGTAAKGPIPTGRRPRTHHGTLPTWRVEGRPPTDGPH